MCIFSLSLENFWKYTVKLEVYLMRELCINTLIWLRNLFKNMLGKDQCGRCCSVNISVYSQQPKVWISLRALVILCWLVYRYACYTVRSTQYHFVMEFNLGTCGEVQQCGPLQTLAYWTKSSFLKTIVPIGKR